MKILCQCLYFWKMISNFFLGIRNAGDTALLVLFVLFGIASLICVFHSPRQVLIIYIWERNSEWNIYRHAWYYIIMCLQNFCKLQNFRWWMIPTQFLRGLALYLFLAAFLWVHTWPSHKVLSFLKIETHPSFRIIISITSQVTNILH